MTGLLWCIDVLMHQAKACCSIECVKLWSNIVILKTTLFFTLHWKWLKLQLGISESKKILKNGSKCSVFRKDGCELPCLIFVSMLTPSGTNIDQTIIVWLFMIIIIRISARQGENAVFAFQIKCKLLSFTSEGSWRN